MQRPRQRYVIVGSSLFSRALCERWRDRASHDDTVVGVFRHDNISGYCVAFNSCVTCVTGLLLSRTGSGDSRRCLFLCYDVRSTISAVPVAVLVLGLAVLGGGRGGGIGGHYCSWLSSALLHRKVKVKVRGFI